MSRADRPFACLYRLAGVYFVSVLSRWTNGYTLVSLGSDPRTARRRLRAALRAWGWPGRDVRDACALVGRAWPAYPSWPKRLRGAS